jgi:tripartite ATP-independent transporter DctM subunit
MEFAAIGFGVLLLLCFLGFPLGFSMIAIGFVGFAVVRGVDPALATVGQLILGFAMDHGFSVLPLFVLMGTFVYRAELSQELYDFAYAFLGHYRGGLALTTVAACGAFSAVSGSSVATAATMAKVAMPSMTRYGYNRSLAAGSIAAGGTLGILIPPSIALVVYGLITEQDIGKLFIAGIVPGALTVLLYLAVIAVVTWIKPELGPKGARTPWPGRLRAVSKVWGVVVLFLLVLGGIYVGWFTPTEAGGIGAVGAFAFAVLRGKMSAREFVASLVEAGRTTAVVFSVALGAIILSNFINIAGVADELVDWIKTLHTAPIGVVLVICVIYVALGCVFEGIGMILLTVPIFYPVIQSLDLGLGQEAVLIWFGIVVVIVTEISLITPPIGLNVFVMKTVVPDLTLWSIFRGIGPFFVADMIRLSLVVFVPSIALWLPTVMG